MKQLRGIGRIFEIAVLVLALVSAMGGCFIRLPFPTLDQGEGLSESQVDERLASGQFMREDVLLTFGPPLRHMEKDRYFVYRWDRTHWAMVGVIMYPILIPGTAQGFAYAPQYLAIEFNPNGKLLRYKYFSRGKASSDDEYFNKVFPEWVIEPHSDSR